MSGRFSNVSTKIRQIIYHLKHGFFSIENLVLFVCVFSCLIFTGKSIVAMTKNWELAENLAATKKNLELLELEVDTAELENEYYKTDEYQEISARKFLNKSYPDEHLVYLPANSDEAKNKHAQTASTGSVKNYSNFEKWLLFLFPDRS